MIQHPIPQNVTGYQFRLIGDMTIKQFIFLSAGIAGAIFFYYTNLFSMIKWIFVLTSAALGFAIAFLPFEERPLDQWILNYIHAIYKPTQFLWRKQHDIPDYFSFVPDKSTPLPSDIEEVSRIAAMRREQGLRSYLVTLPQEEIGQENWEKSYLSQITALFGSTLHYTPPPLPSAAINISNLVTNTSSQPTHDSLTTESETVKPLKRHHPDDEIRTGVINVGQVHIAKDTEETQEINVSQESINANDTFSNLITPENFDSHHIVSATTTQELPFPSTPTTPNTIVGMVLDANNKIVDNAIVEVIDESGLPVRATKTNQLGQFFSTTPLKRGVYHITTDKPGSTFDTIELNIVGGIVQPLKIQAK